MQRQAFNAQAPRGSVGNPPAHQNKAPPLARKTTKPEKKRGTLPVSLAQRNRANLRKLPLQITVALEDIEDKDEGSPVPPGTLARTHGLQCALSFGYEIHQLVKSPRARQQIATTRPLPAGPADATDAALYGRVIAACAEERKVNRKVEKRKKEEGASAPNSPSKQKSQTSTSGEGKESPAGDAPEEEAAAGRERGVSDTPE